MTVEEQRGRLLAALEAIVADCDGVHWLSHDDEARALIAECRAGAKPTPTCTNHPDRQVAAPGETLCGTCLLG